MSCTLIELNSTNVNRYAKIRNINNCSSQILFHDFDSNNDVKDVDHDTDRQTDTHTDRQREVDQVKEKERMQ